ncbi:MAG TPA: nucleotidyltransferase family protein [Sphingobium sp.]|nr:nucleotidyltransferase family protein [Sphingobium sp.]
MARGDPIALALLGAGRSVRFGSADKLMTPLCGRPLIAWAADTGRMLPAEWHLLVAGGDAALAAAAPGYRLIANPAPEQGLSGSLRIAVDEASRLGAAALVVLLGDMPFVTPAHLHQLVAAFGGHEAQPVFTKPPQGAPRPPALFPAACFATLRQLDGDQGARALASGAPLVTADSQSLLDIDTPDDIIRAEAICCGSGRRG